MGEAKILIIGPHASGKTTWAVGLLNYFSIETIKMKTIHGKYGNYINEHCNLNLGKGCEKHLDGLIHELGEMIGKGTPELWNNAHQFTYSNILIKRKVPLLNLEAEINNAPPITISPILYDFSGNDIEQSINLLYEHRNDMTHVTNSVALAIKQLLTDNKYIIVLFDIIPENASDLQEKLWSLNKIIRKLYRILIELDKREKYVAIVFSKADKFVKEVQRKAFNDLKLYTNLELYCFCDFIKLKSYAEGLINIQLDEDEFRDRMGRLYSRSFFEDKNIMIEYFMCSAIGVGSDETNPNDWKPAYLIDPLAWLLLQGNHP